MDIKVRDLKQTETIKNSDKLMVLVDDDLNLVKNINKEEFLTNIISETENNALVQETDGNLYVNTSEIVESVTALDNKFTGEIGDLNNLTTEAKNNLVSAINEAAQFGGSGNGTSLPLFTPVVMDYILSFEESQGFALQGTYVYKTGVAGERYGYPDFIQKCIDQKEAGTESQVTLGNNTITIYTNANGHQFYDISDKAVVDAWFDTYGVAWFYGVDTENERVFLPRCRATIGGGIPPKTIPVVGTGKAMGITFNGSTTAGYLSGWMSSANNSSAFSRTNTVQSGYPSNSFFGAGVYGLTPVASESGVVANVSSLGEHDIIGHLYIVVGNTETQSAITDVVDITTSENDTIPLGFSLWQGPNVQTSVGWLASESQWNSGALYETFYAHYQPLIGQPFQAGYVRSHTEEYTDYDLVINEDDLTFRLPLRNGQEGMFLDGTVPVIGNGKTLGLTNGTVNFGSYKSTSSNAPRFGLSSRDYGKSIGASISDSANTEGNDTVIGLTQNPSQSGVVADLSNVVIPEGYKLYFKVSNAVQNLELLNLAQLMSQISLLSARPYIKDFYQNGTSQYVVWSNGYCIQSGTTTGGTITFLKKFANANYSISDSVINTTSTNLPKWSELVVTSRTVTGMAISTASAPRSWTVAGQLAQGEY